MRKKLLVAALLGGSFLAAPAQTQERGGMNMPPGENVVGKVTAVSKDSLTIMPLMGGEPVTVKVSDSTRVMKERQPIKLEDIKTVFDLIDKKQEKYFKMILTVNE